MDIRTHHSIAPHLCGTPRIVEHERAEVLLITSDVMVADERGLVHGGFVFGAVDYAAMLAVNDPNVVLGGADVRFLAPVRLGDEVVATAEVSGPPGKKRIVEVSATVAGKPVLSGRLTCFVLDKHVLD